MIKSSVDIHDSIHSIFLYRLERDFFRRFTLIILGLDPGLAIIGYGILYATGNSFRVLSYGIIETYKEQRLTERLQLIYEGMTQLIEKYSPDEMAIEELFFNKNAKTAITVGQARGVEILAAVHHQIPVYEYTPLQAKQAVVGYGRAEKIQIQESVKLLLNLKEIPKPDDAADALAIALCHGFSLRFKDQFLMK